MGFKIRKKRVRPARGRRQFASEAQPMLITIPLPGAERGPHCDCPICQAMGIDASELDGPDVRSLTPEELGALAALGVLNEG